MQMTRRMGAIAMAIACAGSATAQVALEQFERQLEQIQRQAESVIDSPVPTEQRALLDYGGFVTFSLLSIDDIEQNSHILRQTDVNGYARLNFDNAHLFYVRGQYQYRDFNTGDDFDGEGDDGETTLERAYYRFDLAGHMAAYEGTTPEWNVTVQGGRQLVHWFNGLTLSREIDGGIVTVGNGPLNFEVLAGTTWDNQFDIDSSRPNFDDDTQRDFYGGIVSWQVHERHRPFLYGLVQSDRNDEDFDPDSLSEARAANPAVFVGVPLIPTRYEYDSWYIGAGSTGTLADQLFYSVEAVYQGGETLSNSLGFDVTNTPTPLVQTDDDIEAWAVDGRIDYMLYDANNTRLSLELLLASGDDDREHTSNTFLGNRSGTTDKAFNGFGLINTGLAFSPTVSNLVMLRGGVSTFPMPGSELLKRMQIGADVYWYNKLDSEAPIAEPTSDDGYLGIETDIFVNWQFTSDFSIGARYGVFFPGDAIEVDNDARHFAFLGVTYSF